MEIIGLTIQSKGLPNPTLNTIAIRIKGSRYPPLELLSNAYLFLLSPLQMLYALTLV